MQHFKPFDVEHDGLFAKRTAPKPFRNPFMLLLMDVLAVAITLGVGFELGAEVYLHFFHEKAHLHEDASTIHNIDIWLDVVFMLAWMIFVNQHFRHNAEDVEQSALVLFLPVIYTPYYHFRTLRPILARKLHSQVAE